jgi:hypothetical protein
MVMPMASKGGVIVVVSGEDKTGEVFKAIDKHMAETQAKAKETSASLGSIGAALQSGLGLAGIVVSVQALVGAFKEIKSSTMEAGVHLAHLSEQTGISVQNLSVLKYAAESTGVDFEVLTKGFKKLAVTTYDADTGNKTAAKGFAQLGISVQELRAKGDDMYGVMSLVTDKFHAMPDGIKKSDTAAKIFGARMGSEMIPVLDTMGGKLDDVKAEAQALGIVWDEAGIKKMEAMHHTAVMLKGSLQGLGMAMITNLAPALDTVISKLTSATQKMRNWLDLDHNIEKGAQGDRATSLVASLPPELSGFANPDKSMHEAAGQKSSLEKQLANVNLSRTQKAALQKKWNDADLRENAAYFAKLNDQIATAYDAWQKQLKKPGMNGGWAKMSDDKKALNALLGQQSAAMSRIDDAQKRTQGPKGAIDPYVDPAAARKAAAAARKADELAKQIAGSEERVNESRRQLAEAGAKSLESIARAHAETQLAALDSAHKLGLISESAYLSQKRSVQNTAFDAEAAALQTQKVALNSQMITLSRTAVRKTEPERLELEAKMTGLKKQEIDLDTKLADLDERRKKAAIDLADAAAEALKKQKQTIAEMEAELEKLSGHNSTKSVAEQKQKSGEERQALANGGATPAQLAEFDALEKIKEQKIQIEALDRQSEEISTRAALEEAQVEQQALGHTLSARDADDKLMAIHKDEIAQMQALAAAYAQFGEVGADAYARIEKNITENMQAIQKETDNSLKQAGEGMAHALFDPLFSMSTAWNKKGQEITDGMMRMMGQLAEKQLMGSLFGDDSGKTGAGGRKGISGPGGLVGEGLSALSGLFGRKKADPTSNGTGAAGAGTIAPAAASLAQLGKGVSGGTGGVQVILNNTGTALDVDSTQVSGGDGGEGQIIQVVLKQLSSNGPVAQGIVGLFNH